MKISSISFTYKGYLLQHRLLELMVDKYEIRGFHKSGQINPAHSFFEEIVELENKSLKEWTKEQFEECDALLFIGACGIAVRSIAPFIADKYKDPAVVVMDEDGENVISLLSGHIGGGNKLTYLTAGLLNSNPVITTATDLNKLFAVDLFAKKNGLHITDKLLAKEISATILNGEKVRFDSELLIKGDLPCELVERIYSPKQESYGIKVSIYKQNKGLSDTGMKELWLIPKTISIGIGCRRDIKAEELRHFVLSQLDSLNIDPRAVENIASIDLKQKENAILELCKTLEVPFLTYSGEKLMEVTGEYEASDYVRRVTGADNVCERAAKLASRYGLILLKKTKGIGMTMAIALKEWRITFE